ncbi:MAG: hypothetical protein WC476_12790 [Phycisphaerae bacterium]|jgi:hypothetical protein
MLELIIFIVVLILLIGFAVQSLVNRVDKLWYFLKHHKGQIGKEFRDYIKE